MKRRLASPIVLIVALSALTFGCAQSTPRDTPHPAPSTRDLQACCGAHWGS